VIRYTLSPVAQQDLLDIRGYYLEQGSPRAGRKILVEFVEAFRTLARTPALGHKRQDLAGERPVLFWTVRDYLIIYRGNSNVIEVVTVVRASRDVRALLRRT
jgi:plasmid stabilization system protein ParE